jgi:hypothetical protein
MLPLLRCRGGEALQALVLRLVCGGELGAGGEDIASEVVEQIRRSCSRERRCGRSCSRERRCGSKGVAATSER